MDRQEILKQIVGLFIERGYRSLRIDDIVKELSMSKKTLYDMFGGKKKLIEEALKYEIDRMNKFVKEGEQKENFFVNISFVVKSIYEYEPPKTQNANFQELKKYYPNQHIDHVKRSEKFITDFITKVMKRGVKEGYVKDDMEISSVAHIFATNYMNMIQRDYSGYTDISRYINNYINLLIQGVLSPKGYEYFKKNPKLL